jgi:Flp pilus assembly protein TadG
MPLRFGVADRGAAAVEFALILPLFLLLVFGMIGGGRVLATKMSMTHAANEGSRFGATFPTPNDPTQIDTWLGQVAQVTVAAANGDLAASVPARSICVAYHDGAADTDRKLQDGAGSDGLCFPDGRPDAESRVQVWVQRTTPWDMMLIPSWNVALGAQSVSRYEVVAVPTPSPTVTP